MKSARSIAKRPAAVLEERTEEAAELLTSMANPKRLLVLCHLVEGERSVGELADLASLNQSALSQHLTKMRLQGLVKTRRDGQTIFYSLASDAVREVLKNPLCDLLCPASQIACEPHRAIKCCLVEHQAM